MSNHLANSSSPYLLQHANNPVDWYEWGDEAFEKAKREDKLVLLSIGYSACHWCHVMAHECFENEETAKIMNAHFVCVKVDREERPDIDQVYMDAAQIITGQGGWPLNVFTLPDARPVHGGTYFPRQEWERLLHALADFYKNRKEEALGLAAEIGRGLHTLNAFAANATFSFEGLVPKIIDAWKTNLDLQLGGSKWAPKFPMPHNWKMLLRYHHHYHDDVALNAAEATLKHMAFGGIYDQIGGGFARYATDVFWKVPHFEKMLYDNALLISLYTEAYRFNKNPLYKKVLYETHEYLQNEMLAPEGIYYSALDADSEGVEGKYYCWTRAELKALLADDEALFSLYYSVDAYGNWEHGENILYRSRSDGELEQLTRKPIEEINMVIERCKNKLMEQRAQRVKPGLDDKCVCSWNALLIKAYAEASLVFDDTDFLSASRKAADFMLREMMHDGKLFRIYKSGKASIPAFSEDYAALCEALIWLFQASGEEKYLHDAQQLLTTSLSQFFDADKKLFRFRSKQEAELVTVKYDTGDDVIPSSNSIFAHVLHDLGYYFSDANYERMAQEMLEQVMSQVEKYPGGHANWLMLILKIEHPFYQVLCGGPDADKKLKVCYQHYIPGMIVARLPSALPLAEDKAGDGLIYVCEDKTCHAPASSIETALEYLDTA